MAPGGFGYLPPAAPMMPGAGGDVNTTLPLLLNVIALVMCGATLISAPFAIAGIVLAVHGKNALAAGDVLRARTKARQSTVAFAIAMLVGLVLFAAWQYLSPAPRG